MPRLQFFKLIIMLHLSMLTIILFFIILGEYDNMECDPEFSGFVAAHETKCSTGMDLLPLPQNKLEKHYTETDTVKSKNGVFS